ncbi:MAG: Ig-like domain-containing protein, partial [Vicinamibacterales bacterium]
MRPTHLCVLFASCALALPLVAAAQAPAAAQPAAIVATPAALTLEIGKTATIAAEVKDASGAVVPGATVVYFSRSRRDVGVNAAGIVEAYRPGTFTVVALVPRDPGEDPRRAEAVVQAEITVTVPNPPVRSVTLDGVPGHFYAGTIAALGAVVTDEADTVRTDVPVTWASADPRIAAVDRFGRVRPLAPGSTTITATAERATARLPVTVEANPVASFSVAASAESARTGDVLRFTVTAKDGAGNAVPDLPIQYAVTGTPAPAIIAPGATAEVHPDGRFVAERAGTYTVMASDGAHSAMATVEVTSRDVGREVELVGRGIVRDRRTSDLWVWTAPDGRDYAVTGTWGADGHANFWDVTDPKTPRLVDTIRVDARTVNDVKISEDGKTAVISREGASNRKNGLVVLDVSNPSEGVKVLSRYDDQLTGGVHNVFIYDKHVYAVSNGQRFDIINIEDPSSPTRVGRFELDTPGHGIHDVWIADGVAFSSNWADGVVAIDLGGAGKGGSPRNPVQIGSYKYPSGWNHAAFPYKSKSTGKFYTFAGDEAFPYGESPEEGGIPERAAGWIHVIEWDDWANP